MFFANETTFELLGFSVAPSASIMPSSGPAQTTDMMPVMTTTDMMPEMTTTDGMPVMTTTAGMPEMTTTPVIEPSPTTMMPPMSSQPPSDIAAGVALTIVDGDFDDITDGDPEGYCENAEVQIAEKAQVSPDRVENVKCEEGR